jgi:hypothetical protein
MCTWVQIAGAGNSLNPTQFVVTIWDIKLTTRKGFNYGNAF